VDSQSEHAEVHTDLGDHVDDGWNWLRLIGRDKATVDYIVQVPQGARLSGVSSVNGSIEIGSVAGDIRASTVNGEMAIDNAARNLSLSTVNGTIVAEMDALGDNQTVKLDAVNGEIELGVPEDADADFSVTTINGNISSEFPSLQAEKEFPVGNKLNGRLGSGGASVKANAVNGTIRFLKSHPLHATAEKSPAPAPLFYEWHGSGWVTVTNHDFSKDSPAVSAVKKMLALVDAREYSESWKEVASFAQVKGTETDWINLINTNRVPLGKLISRQLVASIPFTLTNGMPSSPAFSTPITNRYPGAPDGPYVTVYFDSAFAEKKNAKEEITVTLEKDGRWRPCGYFIK